MLSDVSQSSVLKNCICPQYPQLETCLIPKGQLHSSTGC